MRQFLTTTPEGEKKPLVAGLDCKQNARKPICLGINFQTPLYSLALHDWFSENEINCDEPNRGCDPDLKTFHEERDEKVDFSGKIQKLDQIFESYDRKYNPVYKYDQL